MRERVPYLSLMLYFHRKWSISSKSVSGGFKNMIMHAAKWTSLLRHDARQFSALYRVIKGGQSVHKRQQGVECLNT